MGFEQGVNKNDPMGIHTAYEEETGQEPGASTFDALADQAELEEKQQHEENKNLEGGSH